MTSNIQSNSVYTQLDANSLENTKSRKQNIFFLILSFILGAETLIAASLLYDFTVRVNRIQKDLEYGQYPLECLYQFMDPDYEPSLATDITSCDLFIQDLNYGVHKRLLWDIQDSVQETLGDYNMSRFTPAIHVGAQHEIQQYQQLLKSGDSDGKDTTGHRLRWDVMNGQVSQQGFMRLSPDGEIVIPQDGLYFVYSQVYFALSPSTVIRYQPFMQYLYRLTESYPKPTILAKAAITPCLETKSDFQAFSSHHGALYQLQRGDKLSLSVFALKAVRFKQDATFFGAFMIS
ncbi:tumor necrosis factor (ligand) superfamily, member 10 like 4 [Chanos chanos]|uniref:Tumor necrosis factor (Ligand) superfamily, member 10 like 4 n=1 Tax=Chanos chanos TaxID=29144 RepID=A0A6J2W1K7_CHACN|nr:tumor necrosis factor ligand superfamily member 10-like [Chanos chanos]